MIKKIYKFLLEVAGEQEVEMPNGARVLSVHSQNGNIAVWAEVTPEAILTTVTFYIVGTGEIPFATHFGLSPQYLGTVVMHNDSLVWHVYYKG